MDGVSKKQHAENLLIGLLIKNGITNMELKWYARQHLDEIDGIMSIFNKSNDREQRLFLTMHSLIAQDQSKKFLAYCQKEFKTVVIPDFNKEDIILLLTAFRHNPVFYSAAFTLCEDLKEGFKIADRQDKKNNITKYPLLNIKSPKISLAANAETSKIFIHEIDHDGICGKLYIEMDEQNYFQFIFEFDEYQAAIPFGLKVCFSTIEYEEYHEIYVLADEPSEREKNRGIKEIKSGIKRAYFSNGIVNDEYEVYIIPNKTGE